MRENFVYRYGDNLYVNLTNRCPNACSFCIRKNGDGIGDSGCLWIDREPSAKDCIELIENLSKNGSYGEVVFCGYGEPTYRIGEMLEIAEYVHSVGKKNRLNTNGLGSVIQKRNIVPELKGKIDEISVSLNCDNAADYDKICHSAYGERAFYEMLEFTKSCIENGIETVLSVVAVDGVNVEKCKEVAKSVGAPLRVREYIK